MIKSNNKTVKKPYAVVLKYLVFHVLLNNPLKQPCVMGQIWAKDAYNNLCMTILRTIFDNVLQLLLCMSCMHFIHGWSTPITNFSMLQLVITTMRFSNAGACSEFSQLRKKFQIPVLRLEITELA